jgi:hypothetical protein
MPLELCACGIFQPFEKLLPQRLTNMKNGKIFQSVEEIPETLYLCIAQVIAFAYKIQGKTPEGWQAAPDSPAEGV